MKKSLVEQYVEDPIHMRLFQQERAIYEVTELLEETMREAGVSRSQLARKLGKSKGWVTQLLDGEANKTIRTIADAFAVLGREYCSFQRPIQIGNKTKYQVLSNIAWSENPDSEDASSERNILKLYDARQSSGPATKADESTEGSLITLNAQMAIQANG